MSACRSTEGGSAIKRVKEPDNASGISNSTNLRKRRQEVEEGETAI